MIRCPHCQATMAMEPHLAGAVIECAKCQKKMRVPGNPPVAPPSPPVEEEPIVVQVISKEVKEPPSPAPGPKDDEEPIVVEVVSKKIEEEPVVSTHPTFDEYWKRSAAVKEELAILKKMELPTFDAKIEPLPELLPTDAAALGEPIAFLGRTEHSDKHWLFFPGLCMVVACLCCLGSCATLVTNKYVLVKEEKADAKNNDKLSGGAVLAIFFAMGGVLCVGIGVISLFPHRTNSANLQFWLCKRGILWSRKKGGIGCARWEEITEAYDDLQSEMVVRNQYGINRAVLMKYAVYRIRIDDELVVFTGGFAFANYVICKAAQANFQPVLKRIYAGKSVSFSAIDLSSSGIFYQGKTYAWSTIEEANLVRKGKHYHLMLETKKKKKSIEINAHNISLAPAALAVCRALIEDYKEFPNSAPVSIAAPDPFDF